jgi:3-hydroxyacyl-CoA dehydrogenase/enoyl-CoA hydratase/3-hydroxybutyryl-CoA epimerase/3-hydroxyacyl-CoA dehydrogenase/enoyl-CoA hydratase/3-hydroxybutyryl-CoA epimerase/enoyl-CoA isomerase
MTSPTQSSLSLEILDGNIAQLTLDQPGSRANTLGQAVLADLETMARQLGTRKDLNGLILRSGKPGMFIAGADLKELGAATGDPKLTRLLVARGLGIVAAYENLPFPTVACVDGACAGGGLELSLGFDYRLASSNPKTELGLPEVKIGLIPGWGGTQRLTRLIGPSLAAEMICAGELAKAEKARQLGIVFDVVPVDHLVDAARRLLAWSHQSGDWQKARQRKRQPIGLSEEQYSFAYAAARGVVVAKAGPHYPAPPAALDAIFKGANLPLEDGLKVETEAFAPLVGSRESLNLIAVFFMTQRLQKDPGVSDVSIKPRDIRQAGVIGAGIMGAGIAGAHVRRWSAA